MSSYIQVISLLVSLLYGIIFYCFSSFNKTLLLDKSILKQFIINLIFILDIVFIYIYLMYHINQGQIHVYYIVLVVLGYWFGYKYAKKCKYIVNKIISRKHKS